MKYVICATLEDEQRQRQDRVFRSKELHFTKGVVQILFMVTNKRKKKKTVAGWMLRFVSIWHPCLYIGNTVYTSISIYISCALSSKIETFLNSSFADTFFQRSFLFSFLYFIIFSWHICTADLSFKWLRWHIHAFLDKLPQPAVGGSISRTHVHVHETQTCNPLLNSLPYSAAPPLINMFVFRNLEGFFFP